MPQMHKGLNGARTMRDLFRRLGGVPMSRVRLHPPPGTATEADLHHVLDHENVPCELIDGVLVEKPMGATESILAARLIRTLGTFVEEHKLGEVGGPDLTLRVMKGLIRLPDVAYISAKQFPGGLLPSKAAPALVPELIVEILSRSNTRAEMARKRREFFLAGTQIIWIVYPNKRTVEICNAGGERTVLTETDILNGEDVLRGFLLPLSEFFAGVPKRPARPRRNPKRKKP